MEALQKHDVVLSSGVSMLGRNRLLPVEDLN